MNLPTVRQQILAALLTCGGFLAGIFCAELLVPQQPRSTQHHAAGNQQSKTATFTDAIHSSNR